MDRTAAARQRARRRRLRFGLAQWRMTTSVDLRMRYAQRATQQRCWCSMQRPASPTGEHGGICRYDSLVCGRAASPRTADGATPCRARALAALRAKVVDADREAMAGKRSGKRLPQPGVRAAALRDHDSAYGAVARPR